MMTNMNYEKAADWILREIRFDPALPGKTESVMCLGNGYLGIRSAAEEKYLNETRNCFVAGTFNKADKTEVTELPNTADLLNMELYLDGERFTLENGKVLSYEKSIHLKYGELVREVVWISPKDRLYHIRFLRFVSMDDLHIIGQKITVSSNEADIQVRIQTGIDGRSSNSGAQHFEETQKRCYDKRYLQYVQTTVESGIGFVLNSTLSLSINDKPFPCEARTGMARRRVYEEYEMVIPGTARLTIEKISNVHTTRDWDFSLGSVEELQAYSLETLKSAAASGYDSLFRKSLEKWEEYWQTADIKLDCADETDRLALRFAQYHLRIMTPFHDDRMNVGAKGLSGEGYKGHTFWDTEIFILPYFTFQFPDCARRLLRYRYYGLDGARRKAGENGYKGAQYPWEAAWIQDGEVTPAYGDVDVVTGMPQKIWTGQIEQHITSDVIYGLWQYYQMTGDTEFMETAGCEMIFETASFWSSRLEAGEDGYLHINDVIGPDEYKEHVDDNAFTNYMAYWNIRKAIECCDTLEKENSKLWASLDEKINLQDSYPAWKESLKHIYLPKPDADGIIPQDATYLTLRQIDLDKYKKQDYVLGIYRDYNAAQLNQIQVSKQADILILFYLLENYFTQEVKQANWNYYEPRTLHDSSLSLSTHCILANDIGNGAMAYSLFRQLCGTDMGPDMNSSNGGIHAASLGGIWQSAIFGFAGIRLIDGKLRVHPCLPKTWNSIEFTIHWKQIPLTIKIDRKTIRINTPHANPTLITVEVNGVEYTLCNELTIPCPPKPE